MSIYPTLTATDELIWAGEIKPDEATLIAEHFAGHHDGFPDSDCARCERLTHRRTRYV